jgi:hypothetical protein
MTSVLRARSWRTSSPRRSDRALARADSDHLPLIRPTRPIARARRPDGRRELHLADTERRAARGRQPTLLREIRRPLLLLLHGREDHSPGVSVATRARSANGGLGRETNPELCLARAAERWWLRLRARDHAEPDEEKSRSEPSRHPHGSPHLPGAGGFGVADFSGATSAFRAAGFSAVSSAQSSGVPVGTPMCAGCGRLNEP